MHTYWIVEVLDGPATAVDDPDILGVIHVDSASMAIAYRADEAHARIALVRDHPRLGRAWAYVGEGNTLPDHFTDAYEHPTETIPQRYRRELARATRT